MSFQDALNQMSIDTREHLGEDIFIQGLTVRVVFYDSEFEVEAGRGRITTISVGVEDLKFFKIDDSLIVKGRRYRISHIPDVTGPLIDIELKRA